MHPDLMREIMKQRQAERYQAARKTSVLRALRAAICPGGRVEVTDIFAQPIPDYIDGTFRDAQDAVPAGRACVARLAGAGFLGAGSGAGFLACGTAAARAVGHLFVIRS